ncbi:SAM-dependent DNA methyltransferase, partial [bacterium]|nr:SAM-dependent DNA methyltransferase [bacterium]
VILQYWLFLATYKKLRKKLFKSKCWKFLAQLGDGAFETISGAVVNVALTIISGNYPGPRNAISGINAGEETRIDEKKKQLLKGNITIVKQNEQFKNPDCRFLLMDLSQQAKLGEYGIVSEGLHTGDYPRFGRKFWEVPKVTNGWVFQQAAASETIPYGGRAHIIFWEEGRGSLIKFVKERLCGQRTSMWIKGDAVWGKTGVAVSAMSDLRATLYTGEVFTHGAIVVVPKDPSYLQAIWSYLSSPEFNKNVRLLDKKVCVARAAVENIPFDLKYWKAKGKKIDSIKNARCIDPTQWTFSENIAVSANPLQIAVCNLLGYCWPKQKHSIPEGVDNNEGIVCIASLRGEDPAVERLRMFLAYVYGKEWSPSKERELIYDTGSKAKSLEEWFSNDFFEHHCKLFHHRPFIWHIWDG